MIKGRRIFSVMLSFQMSEESSCAKCSRVFASKQNLNRHTREMTQTYECLLCPFQSRRKIRVQDHLRVQHRNSDLTQFRKVRTPLSCVPEGDDASLDCPDLGSPFPQLSLGDLADVDLMAIRSLQFTSPPDLSQAASQLIPMFSGDAQDVGTSASVPVSLPIASNVGSTTAGMDWWKGEPIDPYCGLGALQGSAETYMVKWMERRRMAVEQLAHEQTVAMREVEAAEAACEFQQACRKQSLQRFQQISRKLGVVAALDIPLPSRLLPGDV